jgi:uncharacterized coiled-coil protein SlyX
MTYRGPIEAAGAKLLELEHVLAARDRELARLDQQLAEHDAALAAAMPTEPDRVRLRQLDVAIAETRLEIAQLRAMPVRDVARPGEPPPKTPDPAAAAERAGQRFTWLMALLVVLATALVVWGYVH